MDQLTLLIGVNQNNVDMVEELLPFIRTRDILVAEEGHRVGMPFPYDTVYPLVSRLAGYFVRPNAILGRNRIFVVARPDHLPLANLPDEVDTVLIDHERSSYGKAAALQWSVEYEWQLYAMQALRAIQPLAGIITPPPTPARRDAEWSWEELGVGMLWHNVMVQAAARDGNRLDGNVYRWNERAHYLAEQHGAYTDALSMQITMKPGAQQYTIPERVILCCRAARDNGVPNVLLFGADPEDLETVLMGLRTAAGGTEQ